MAASNVVSEDGTSNAASAPRGLLSEGARRFIPGPAEPVRTPPGPPHPSKAVVKAAVQCIDELSHRYPRWDDKALLAALLRRPNIRTCPIEVLKGLVLMKTVTVRRMRSGIQKKRTVDADGCARNVGTRRDPPRNSLTGDNRSRSPGEASVGETARILGPRLATGTVKRYNKMKQKQCGRSFLSRIVGQVITTMNFRCSDRTLNSCFFLVEQLSLCIVLFIFRI